MPQAVAAAAAAAAAFVAANAVAIAINTAILVGSTLYQRKLQRQRADYKPQQDVMVRSAVEPVKIIYGEVRVSGPVCYVNSKKTPGTDDNSDLWHLIAIAGHEIEDITDIWLDGDEIPEATINWATNGLVTSGKYADKANFYKQLGTSSQTAQSELSSAFPSDWTSAHRLRSVATLTARFELGNRTSQGMWSTGAPTAIRGVVKGKKVYDPRLDSTRSGGSGTQRVTDETTWTYSNNPALCLADYLIDDRLGFGAEGVEPEDVDYQTVMDAADVCDAQVAIPGSTTEKRFTCNGVLYTTSSYEDNIDALLSSMNGTMTWQDGQFKIRAGAYSAPTHTFDETNTIGSIVVEPERPREQRFNTVRGTFLSPDQEWVFTEFLRVTNSDYVTTRDAGTKLVKNMELPMTTGEYEAQRIAMQQLSVNNQQTGAVIGLDFSAMKVGAGDRISITNDELNWSSKIFVVENWKFDIEDGFQLYIREDSSSAYDDPDVLDYSTRTAAGTITFADAQVPSASGLTATSVDSGIVLEWASPLPSSAYDEVALYASADSSWANASKVYSGRNNAFLHKLDFGTTRYYWTQSESSDGRTSVRDPDSDTSSITATAGSLDFVAVSGSTKPEDNADVTALHAINAVDNPSFEAGDKSWTKSGNWTIEENASKARRGDWSADIINGTNEDIVSDSRLQVEPGDRVLAQMFHRRSVGPGALRTKLQWRDADGNGIGTSPRGDDVTVNTWTSSRVIAIAPATAVSANIAAEANNGAGTLNGRSDGAYLSIIPKDADIDALQTTNPPAEAGADVTGNHSADVDALITQNGPVESSATQGLIDLSTSNTDGETNVTTTSWETVQSDSVTVSATETVLLTISANYHRSDGTAQSKTQIRVTQDGSEIGGLSADNFLLPGGGAFTSFLFRRELTLASGSYTFALQAQRPGGDAGNAGFRNRNISIEFVRAP